MMTYIIYFQAWENWFINFYNMLIGIVVNVSDFLKNVGFDHMIILYIILALSFILLVFNTIWYFKDSTLDFLHISVLSLLSLISILEISFILASLNQSIEYLNTDFISWGTFIINFIIFLVIVSNQIFSYILLIKRFPIEVDDYKFVPYTVFSWFILFGLTFLFNWIYLPGNGIGLALTLILQLNFLIILIKGTKYDGGLLAGLIYYIGYLLWSLAILCLVYYYFVYLFIAIAIGFSLMYLIYFISGKIEFNYKAPSKSQSKAQVCPYCGVTYINGNPQCSCKTKIAQGTFYK